MPHNNVKLQHIIENICSTGCERVYEIIAIMERRESIEETSQLNSQESEIVLQELKNIMAVYKQK
ncbi:MAG: hypothetical protein OEY66_06135 [Gammaproteobacteria bacterium]|nr:hypothetical protein [Gammaproteobacteria bacterium]